MFQSRNRYGGFTGLQSHRYRGHRSPSAETGALLPPPRGSSHGHGGTPARSPSEQRLIPGEPDRRPAPPQAGRSPLTRQIPPAPQDPGDPARPFPALPRPVTAKGEHRPYRHFPLMAPRHVPDQRQVPAQAPEGSGRGKEPEPEPAAPHLVLAPVSALEPESPLTTPQRHQPPPFRARDSGKCSPVAAAMAGRGGPVDYNSRNTQRRRPPGYCECGARDALASAAGSGGADAGSGGVMAAVMEAARRD